ncbi:hypothetical protein ACFFX0_17425 [Citricoccus parietis]|uniref:Uncharacterized protein n=1 Tax=Citricoccus parietis TaxID=592307 RepID=A0ABV5G338_9MICC
MKRSTHLEGEAPGMVERNSVSGTVSSAEDRPDGGEDGGTGGYSTLSFRNRTVRDQASSASSGR